MGTAATNRRLRNILVGMKEETLIVNPSFQRRLVWINKHKIAFIQTVLDGLPFPEVFIAAGDVDMETGHGTEVVVDGQQRLTTLFQYFYGSDEIELGTLPAYKDLKEPQKKEFLEYEVVVRDLGSLSEFETRELFQRINSTSYGLNAMEVNNGRYDGALKNFCEAHTKLEFLEDHKVFSVQDGRRMNDTKWILTLVITLLSTYFNRDSEHQSFLDQYNEHFPHANDIDARLEAAFSYAELIASRLQRTRRLYQKSDLFTLVVEIDRIKPSPNDVGLISQRIEEFYNAVDLIASGNASVSNTKASEYFAAIRSGTNDASSRNRRGEVISELLTVN